MEGFIIASTLSALATGVGAIPAVFLKNTSHRWKDMLLAFSAGMMMAATMFELIPESFRLSSLPIVSMGIFLGMVTLTTLEQNIPHEHIERERHIHLGTWQGMDRKALLIITAVTLHNIPEGLSVGVSYSSGVEGLGFLIALAIGIQNAPEGFIIAFFLTEQGFSKTKAFIIALGTGVMELFAAFAGYWLTGIAGHLVPVGLAFAAGSMLYIVYKELIPESHGDGYALSATYSFTIGIVLMLILTNLF
ncbi:ZIP family metal transporter [Alteribacillus sp. HJP-4]|uniref:ZIP family metal transporter n=1 Tax=Alteribacillus sp. HJP-4 TaxID=2775394 RepID=UPI0035CCCCCB